MTMPIYGGFLVIRVRRPLRSPTMDEGTLKTPTSLCRFHWPFCLGWWSNLVGSASGQKQSVCRIWSTQHNSPPLPPPPPETQTVCIKSTFNLGRGGEVREKIEGQQYTSIVPSSMGVGNSSQAGSKIPTNEWMYLQSIKSVKHNAAMSVNRSILKKSRHIGIGLFQLNPWRKYGAIVRMEPLPSLACYLPVWCSDLTGIVLLNTRQ